MHAAFAFAIVACLVAAAASLMRGGRMAAEEEPATRDPASAVEPERYAA